MPRNPAARRFTRLTSAERRAQLIEVGLACLARGGIKAFTADKICLAAGVSRGLILHHFGSMAGLLAAVYAHIYRETTPHVSGLNPPEARLSASVDGFFEPKAFSRDVLKSWVALWGQIANTPTLRDEHRRQYRQYLGDVTDAVAAQAAANGRVVSARLLAKSLICLVDGLSLQHCLDPDVMATDEARAACWAFLEPHLGPRD